MTRADIIKGAGENHDSAQATVPASTLAVLIAAARMTVRRMRADGWQTEADVLEANCVLAEARIGGGKAEREREIVTNPKGYWRTRA